MVKEVSQKSPVAPEPSIIHPYAASDPIPVPDAVESDGDTAWGLWENSILPPSSEADTGFANTVPADLVPLPSDKSFKRRP